ncbi:MAG TPA: hypothetical protein VG126_01000 [Thermoleophilaceae bacterium]|nr:hypothetical protein [Thermoleophilaceae bacterium]
MLARIHAVAAAVWSGLAGGASAGFLARDALGFRQPLVALAWILGATIPLAALARSRMRSASRRPPARDCGCGPGRRPVAPGPRRADRERGQAAVELVALVLLLALALAGLVALLPRFDGRSFGGFLAFRIVCTIQRDCHQRDGSLIRAYGERDAAVVRDLAPNLVYEHGERQLPVDWRRCRRTRCAAAPDDPDLDAHHPHAGGRATAFTRLVRRGARTYVQYWFYYPDSRTEWANSGELWERFWRGARAQGLVRRAPTYPGAHPDDWEAYAIRLDRDGRAWVRAGSHGHWQACKEHQCKNRWTASTGWTRVSRGSHAGHIPLRHELRQGPRWVFPRQAALPGSTRPRTRRFPLLPGHDLRERTTTGEGLRLVPLETLDGRTYRPLDDGIDPPWEKGAYWDPESDES